MKEPRILYYDLETFPHISYTWGKWKQNVIAFKKKGMICSVAWRWKGEEEIGYADLVDYYGYLPEYPTNRKLMLRFYKEYCKADITIAHNGKGFDDKRVRTGFLLAGCKPVPPIMSIDTLQIARSRFGFVSNKLDDLAEEMGVPMKYKHPGFSMWLGCMSGNRLMWNKMRRYNIADIPPLEGIYKIMRAWDTRHPDLSNFRRDWNCPVCGSDEKKFKSYRYLLASVKKQWQCLAKGCGRYYLGPTEKSTKNFPLPRERRA